MILEKDGEFISITHWKFQQYLRLSMRKLLRRTGIFFKLQKVKDITG